MEWIVELMGGVGLTLLGWLHMRQNRLEAKLENCVEKDAFEEMKEELKTCTRLLTDVRLENAKWQGIVERATESNSRTS